MDYSIIFPNQLFKNSELLSNSKKIILVEEFLFFKHYKFHKQKILFHRMSMKSYKLFLEDKGYDVRYIESTDCNSDIRELIETLDINKIKINNRVDNWLSKRISQSCSQKNIQIETYENPLFINNNDDLNTFFRTDKKKFFQTAFYKQQRIKMDIMMISDKPEGGKWTYDDQNREKYPKGKTPPKIDFPEKNQLYFESID